MHILTRPSPLHVRRSVSLVAWVLTIGSALMILHLTLRPYNFHITAELQRFGAWQLLRQFFAGGANPADIFNNIVLFLPFGAGVAWLLGQHGIRPLRALAAALALGAGLSLSVELLQLFLPSRTPTPADVLTNTLGTLLGVLCLHGVGLLFRSTTHVIAALAGYMLLAAACSIPLQSSAQLSGWDANFPLIVGTQHDEDAWQGRMFDLRIFNRALTDQQAAALGAPGQAQGPIDNGVLADYQFSGAGPYHDRTGHTPSLTLRSGTPHDQAEAGTTISGGAWLESQAPAAELNRSIAASSRFTVLATLAAADTAQPTSEIVSLSGADYNRNFILGQRHEDLFLRVRNAASGEKTIGLAPIVIPHVFVDRQPHRIIVTYDRGTLQVYVDGRGQPHALVLSPELALWTFLLPSKIADQLQQQHALILDSRYTIAYEVLYYCLLFVPCGLLLALVSRRWLTTLYRRARVVLLLGAATLIALLLELALVVVDGRALQLDRLAISVAIAAVAWLAGTMLIDAVQLRLVWLRALR